VRVLRRFGRDVSLPDGATCCGQPAWNAGFAADAAQVARATLRALDEAIARDPDLVICVPAGSCATMIRVFWPELFHVAGSDADVAAARRVGAATSEFSELLSDRSPGGIVGSHRRRVAYHHSCHMLRELHLRRPPLDLLDDLDGSERVEWSADERCCGFGGLFSVKLPETSVAMADDKIVALGGTEADELVGCDQSCLLHLRGRLVRRERPLAVKHLAQVLDEAGARPRPAGATLPPGPA
jgi:L-lactate dehydrogenase complex protein LldE